MALLRQRLAQRLGALVVAAALLVPLALSAHGHGSTQLGDSGRCPVCAVTHHSPALTPAPLLQLAPVPPVLTVPTTPATLPVVVALPTKSGRAPPSSLTSSVT
jgi:hypothetical protein